MNYRYFFIILCFISCDKITQKTNESEKTTKAQLYKEYVLGLHDRNLEEVYKNQDFVNILSVKHHIADSVCTEIIVDYLNVVNNQTIKYTNHYKVETIKNYAFENDITETQVANLLYDYFSYRDSNKY